MIKAIEKDGNQASSLSNNTCVEFIPEIKTYNIITPNSDIYNEFFIIENIEHYPNSKLTILNRYGETIYEVVGYKNTWSGKIKGKTAPSGNYYFQLELNEPRNELKSVKGFFSILY
jgi:gliding motility-associated-like protein